MFFEHHGISQIKKKYFILYTNGRIVIDQQTSLKFEDCPNDLKHFISSKPLNISELTISKLEPEEGSMQSDFFENFYLYTDQINISEIDSYYGELAGLESVVSYFHKFLNPSDKGFDKLYKIDIKYHLLDILLILFPRLDYPQNQNGFLILDSLKPNDVVLIKDANSEKIIFRDILIVMEKFREEKKLLLKGADHDENRKLYLTMVADDETRLPFYMRTKNPSFPSFFYKLLPKLRISTVIYEENDSEEITDFQNVRIIKNMNDFDDSVIRRIKVSLQGKAEINLSTLIESDPELKKSISTDTVIKLLDKSFLEIGQKQVLPKYYVNRTVTSPTIKKSILRGRWCLFVICNVPEDYKFGNDDITLDFYLNEINNVDENDENIENTHIVTSSLRYSTELKKTISSMKKFKETFLIL
ncbi:hypothetical protein JTB14_007831 [Gonioctena quinquepunctata]|nr:hypothetical protein JTB14_007831 [Gonioctena quinquepunctata]